MGSRQNPLIRPIVYPRGDRAAFRGEAENARNTDAVRAAEEYQEKLSQDDDQ